MLASLCPDIHGSIRAGALLLLEGSDDLVGHVHGAVNILNVVELLKTVDEALNLLGVGAGEPRSGWSGPWWSRSP